MKRTTNSELFSSYKDALMIALYDTLDHLSIAWMKMRQKFWGIIYNYLTKTILLFSLHYLVLNPFI